MTRIAVVVVLGVGCVIGPKDEDAGPDGGPDAPMIDVGTDAFDGDTGPPVCREGEHLCEGRCIRNSFSDHVNNGCLHGCPRNEPCPEMPGMRRYCEDFQCAYGACLTCEDLPEVECGAVSDGCGAAIDCGECDPALRCSGDNRCVPCPDGDEGSSESAPTHLGTESDIPDSTVVRYATLHDADDEDWWSLEINDRSPRIVPGGGPPNVTVTVSDLPSGVVPRLEVHFECNRGTRSYDCGSGDEDDGAGTCSDVGDGESGSVSVFHDLNCLPNDGDDADGRLTVRVASLEHPGPAMCAGYQLRIRVQ